MSSESIQGPSFGKEPDSKNFIYTEKRPPNSGWTPFDFEPELPKARPPHEKLGESMEKVTNYAVINLMLNDKGRDHDVSGYVNYLFQRNDGAFPAYEEGAYILTIAGSEQEQEICFTPEQASQLRIKKGEELFLGYEDEAQTKRRGLGNKVVVSGVLYKVPLEPDQLAEF